MPPSNSGRRTQSRLVPPLHGIVPKEETNAAAFVRKHDTYDGRGITVGILDTGVDPGAIGLQSLPPGAAGDGGGRKLIDIVDCTGSGDVDVTTEVEATWVEGEDGSESCWEVKGLTGRMLRLNPSWNIQPFPKPINSTKKDADLAEDDQAAKDGEGGETGIADNGEKDGVDGSKTNAKTVKVRLGIKRGYELFPTKLKNRVTKHRRKVFDESQRKHAADVRKLLDKWHVKYKVKTATLEQIRDKEDLEARLEFLEPKGGGQDDGSSPWEDPGPLYDCVVYFDGTAYRAAIDTNESGDLMTVESMTDYDKDFQYGTFSAVDMLNFGVHIYDDGTVLSIVCDAGAHGSHVAGITAAYNPPAAPSSSTAKDGKQTDDLEVSNVDGVAPGAKIVSLKIGDSRLGSMEAGAGLTRALIEAVRHKCDVINMSYGEAAAVCNDGRFIELSNELVNKHGIVFVVSAGNNGPALTTVGSPGGTTSSMLSVAAYVSPAMMEAGYSMITNPRWLNPAPVDDSSKSEDVKAESTSGEDDGNANSEIDVGSSSVLQDALTGSTYTWSSVGPTADGDQGVDICAPGGAITCVPNWTLQRKQLMNGTSMSSPHVAGCIALLLSAAKAVGLAVTPHRMKKAIFNTARVMDGLSNLEQGHGMIQVDKAFEYLLANKDSTSEDVDFKVCIDNRAGRPRGVYLRQANEVSARQTLSINVSPNFRVVDDVDEETQRLRVDFEMNVKLVSTAPSWVHSPDHLVLIHNGRSFKIEVDPTALEPGVHTAHIFGYDSGTPTRGPMFSVPITVVKPLKESTTVSLGKLEFKPSEVKREFLQVPSGASWMDVSIQDLRTPMDKDASPRLVVLHALQLLPHTPYRDNEKERYLNLMPQQRTVTSIPVHEGIVCELCLARYWSAVGKTEVEVQVDFRGVRPTPDVVGMKSGGSGAKVRVTSDLQNEDIMPSAKLSNWLTPLRPKTNGIVTSLGERDILPDGKRIYQLVLDYEFTQAEDGGITPRLPSLQGYLYESAFESQLIMVYDGEKKLLGVADAWPGEVKAPKGPVAIRLQIRHTDAGLLQKLKDQVLWIERKLTKGIALSAYSSHAAMVTGGDTFKKISLRKGKSVAIFFAEPALSDLPKGYKSGDVLEGVVNYSSGEGSLPGQGKKPGGFPTSYVLGPPEANEEKNDGSKPEVEDDRTEAEKLEEAVKKLKVEKLEKLSETDKEDIKFQALYDDVLGDDPESLQLLMVGLKHHDKERWRKKRLAKVVEAADAVVKLVDEDAMTLHYGVTGYYDKDDAKQCEERKVMDENKKTLIEALARKARALADMEHGEEKVGDDGTDKLFSDALRHLQKWADIDKDNKLAVLLLEREKRAGRPGSVLRLLKKLLANNGEDTKDGICPLTRSDILQRRAEAFRELGYDHLAENDKIWKIISSPKDFALF